MVTPGLAGIVPTNVEGLQNKLAVSQEGPGQNQTTDKFQKGWHDAKLIGRNLVAMPFATGLTVGLPPAVTAGATAIHPVLGGVAWLAGFAGATSMPGFLLWQRLGGDIDRSSFNATLSLNFFTCAVAGAATAAFGLKAGLEVSAAIGGVAALAEAVRAAR